MDWAAKGTSRSMLIIGAPGLGKSAIVAKMVENRKAMGGIAWYCCRWDYADQLAPRVFVEAIAASLADNLPAYAQALQTSEIQKLLEKAQTGGEIGPRTLFEQLVLSQLAKLPDPPQEARLILIDALDESLSVTPGIVDLLADTLNQWPEWLRIIATTRPNPEVLDRLHAMKAEALNADDDENRADLAHYVAGRLGPSPAGNECTVSGDSIYNGVLDTAQGNFLVADALINEILAGNLSVEELNVNLGRGHPLLPRGLQIFYKKSFARLFPSGGDFAPARAVLGLSLSALEPLDLPILQAASGLGTAKVDHVLKRLASFLPLRPNKRFEFFHKSVRDWLDSETVDPEYGGSIAGRFAIDVRAGREALAEWMHKAFQSRGLEAPGYVLQHRIAHLRELGDMKQLRTLLFDFGWYWAKHTRLGIQAVLEDFEQLPPALAEEAPLRLLHRTLQMTAHILVRSPEQLAPQLLGRLPEALGPEIVALRQTARNWRDRTWLCPLQAEMKLPGALLQVLEGHEERVASVAFSPDGNRILSGSLDNTLRLWDAKSGEPVGEPIRGHERWVWSVAFSPDGTRIVSGSFDHTLRLWDAKSGKPISEPMQGHDDRVASVAFSPDGNRIVSGGLDHTLRLWDAKSGKLIGEPMRGHQGWVRSVAFSPDGSRILSGSDDSTLRLWDAMSGKLIGEPFQGIQGIVMSVTFSPNGSYILSGSGDSTLRLWDAKSGKPIGEPMRGHEGAVRSVTFSPDGGRIVSGSDDNTLRLWDTKSRKPIGKPLRGHEGWVRSVAFSPDGNRILSGSSDKTLRLWDAKGDLSSETTLQGHQYSVESVAFSRTSSHIVSGSSDQTLRLWDTKSGKPIGQPMRGHEGSVSSVAFSPDSPYIVSGSWDKTLRLWDAKNCRLIGQPMCGHEGAVESVAFSPDGAYILSGSDDSTLRLWDAKSGKPIGEPMRGHEGAVRSVAFSPDGSRIVSGSSDKTLRLWDAKNGKPIGPPMRGHKEPVSSVAFRPKDGARIVSGSWDKTLRLWDAKNGQLVGAPMQGHQHWVCSVAFSPDGSRVVSGSWDKTLRLWQIESGKILSVIELDSGVFAVSWHADQVAAGEMGGSLHVFRIIEPDDPVQEPP